MDRTIAGSLAVPTWCGPSEVQVLPTCGLGHLMTGRWLLFILSCTMMMLRMLLIMVVVMVMVMIMIMVLSTL